MRSLKYKIFFISLTSFFLISCGAKKPGYYKRVNGHKVWFPDKEKKLDRRYEKCPF